MVRGVCLPIACIMWGNLALTSHQFSKREVGEGRGGGLSVLSICRDVHVPV